jgi:hypothetical protein
MTSLILKWFRPLINLSIYEMFEYLIILRICYDYTDYSMKKVNFQVRFIEIFFFFLC